MNLAVNLDNQTRSGTIEIHDKGSYSVLAPEFQTAKASVS
jgi:hypothetical protein